MNSPNLQSIDFLTRPENVECTLEILALREGVYGRLLNDFWRLLLTSLESRTPASYTAEMKQWNLDPGLGGMGELDYAWADSSLTPPPTQGQGLRYRIQQHQRHSSYHLFFGLLWHQTLEKKTVVPQVEGILEIKKYHADAQFNMQGDIWFCGWTSLFHKNSREEFFAQFTSERDQMTNRYAERFWTYVTDTRDWVNKSNLAMQGGAKAPRRTKP